MAAGPVEGGGEPGGQEEGSQGGRPGAGYGDDGGADGTGARELWIVHRELRDRAVRLFAEEVRAGVYHIYYPVIAATAGEYRTPGPRAEFLYSPEIYGVGSPQTVKVARE